MATQYSVDYTVEVVVLSAMFLEDGYLANVHDFETHGCVYVGGDIVTLERDDREQQAVVFVVGADREEADKAARLYVRRLKKWHGGEGEGDSQMIFLGHGLSQSQLFK